MADKRFIKGLFKDTGNIDQPEGSWRHARNMVLNEKDGSVSNEGGTSLGGHLGTNNQTGAQNDKVIGAIEVDNDRTVLFITDVATALNPRSEIGIWEKDAYTPLFKPELVSPNGQLTNDLNFKEDNPIEGTFKINPKGDLIVYWTDDFNPPRAFNVDRQLRESTTITELYGISGLDLDNIDILNLFPYSGPVPHIDVLSNVGLISSITGLYQTSVIEGGGLLTAVYYLALAYVDDDLVATNFLTVSNPISIVDEFDHTIPTTKKDGAKAGSQTTKAIRWGISNLNTNYKYLRPVVIRSMGNSQEAFKLKDVTFTTDTTEIIYSGLETSATGSPSEVIIDTISYDTAKTIQQLDNILYLGNTTGSKDIGYQKYANNIKLESRVDLIPDFDEYYASVDNFETGWGYTEVNQMNGVVQTVQPSQSYRYAPNIFKFKGYMRDEVYAFYIAFVMKDGSMSYAYHIPGRKDYGDERQKADTLQGNSYGGLWEDIQKVSREYSKLFHWVDSSTPAIYLNTSNNSNNSGLSTYGSYYNQMNYWENATEFYPDTDNYEVWTNTNGGQQKAGASGSIQGLNVRHHHFPSNRNEDRKSIVGHNCETDHSIGSSQPITPWQGTFEYGYRSANFGPIFNSWTNPVRAVLNDFQSGTGNLNTAAATSNLWDGTEFTADQAMTVTVRFRIWHERSWPGQSGVNGSDCEPSYSWIGTNATAATGPVGGTLNPTPFNAGPGCCNGCPNPPSADFICNYGGCNTTNGFDVDFTQSGTITYDLQAGEKIWINGASDDANDPGKFSRQARGSNTGNWGIGNGCSCPPCNHYVQFGVQAAVLSVPPEDFHDAKISHNVQRLGFNLKDIRIPQSMADKVQGFRIYYANRKHSDRTILGQSPIIPALYKNARLGICSEALNVTESAQVLSTLQDLPEDFYSMDPFARWATEYPVLNFYQENGNASAAVGPIRTTDSAMNVFSFHDFYLLRTKNSLAAATHINVEYSVENFAWNGPGVNQDKKMVTILSPGSNPTLDPLTVREVWGWNADQNCYPREMYSAIFIGCNYKTPSPRTMPRLIGQKAKTYLLGDSIFLGGNLGFGGKLFNEFGESSIVFKLMDNHALGALKYQSSPASNNTGFFFDKYGAGHPNIPFGHYGSGQSESYATLTNLLDNNGDWQVSGGLRSHGDRSQVVIANLKAFKTDLYKSIDSQELVWTGFEVLGDQLDNYTISETGSMGTGTGDTIDTHPNGIYGGDTFLCRYATTTSLKPSNETDLSSPVKAIHYQIVESTDNINFRHTEDNDSLYFPNGVAKTIIRNAGPTDFNHFDNIKYNHNYSEVNNIRPAFPLPVREVIQDDFSTRTHRSAKHDTTSIIDNYRIFLGNQFKDLPKNRGDLWKLSSFNNLLYFHMQESLFAAQGKQTMEMKDGSEAFVGSGDIFAQEPNELVQTEGGFGGTQSQYAALTTRYGYFFVDASSRKVFMMKEQLLEISSLGMEEWFRENLGFELFNHRYTSACGMDNPIKGMGFHSVYDPKFKRIILTKREFIPKQTLINGLNLQGGNFVGGNFLGQVRFNKTKCIYQRWEEPDCQTAVCPPLWVDLPFNCSGFGEFTCGGWTISYYPELGVWGSFHDYVPYIYFNTSTDFYSLTDQYLRPVWRSPSNPPATALVDHQGTTYGNAGIWKHNAGAYHGILYQEWTETVQDNISEELWLSDTVNHFPFELEFIHNEYKSDDVLLSSFNYTLETFNQENISVLENGFTSFFIYNTFQMSGENALEYLINTRRIGNNWKINKFRDMAAIVNQTGSTITGLNLPNTSPYYMSTNTNIIGGLNTGTTTTSTINNMFTYDGMLKNINAAYLDLTKTWNLQKKFIDKWVGIRLIYNNISNNSLNLYATNVVVRKTHR